MSYLVPAFTTSPTGQEANIVYTAWGALNGATFSARTFDWSTLSTAQTFTLTMNGRLGVSPEVSASFTVTIHNAFEPSIVIQTTPTID